MNLKDFMGERLERLVGIRKVEGKVDFFFSLSQV